MTFLMAPLGCWYTSSSFAIPCDIAWDNLKTSARATILIQDSRHHLSLSSMSFVTVIGRQRLMLTLVFLTCLAGRLSIETLHSALKSYTVFLLFCIPLSERIAYVICKSAREP